MTKIGQEPSRKCHRCGGLGTIVTPDNKSHQICPICGGTGVSHPKPEIKWG